MSLQGNLSGFTLAEIFRMISFAAKTGNLVIARDAAQGRVHFRDGEVYFASTPENRQPLGLRLVSSGMITQEQLDDALAEQKTQPDRRLGEILVSHGLIARDTLVAFVREQIQDALFEIFEWDDGTYYFEPAVDTDEDIGVALSVDEIVAEAERRRQEWEQIRAVLPSIDSRVCLSMNAVALGEMVELEPQEWAAVCHIAHGTDLQALRGCLHVTSLGLCGMIAGLIARGVLEAASEFEPIAHRFEEIAGTVREPVVAQVREPVVAEVQAPEREAAEVMVAPEPVVAPAPETADEPSPVTSIRKYIRESSGDTPVSGERKDYPIEWLTYYGRLHHRRSRGPSARNLRDKAYQGVAVDKD